MSSSVPAREKGWGAAARNERFRAQFQSAAESDDDAFVYKRTKVYAPKKSAEAAVAAQTPAVAVTSATDNDVLTDAAPLDVSSVPTVSATTAPHEDGGATKKKRNSKRRESHDENAPAITAPASLTIAGPPTVPIPQPQLDTATTTSTGGARLVYACLVELFEMLGVQKAKGFGPKGLALVKTIDNAYSLLVYNNAQTTKHELAIDLTVELEFIILPDRFATFTDPSSGRNWSVKFSSIEFQHDFARAFAMCKDDLSAFEFLHGGARRVIMQDLALGSPDFPLIQGGDVVKVKYVVHLTSATHPIGIGEAVVSRDSKKFTVGEGTMSVGIEQGVLGMRKKGVRFIVVPPMMMDEVAEWGPHVPVNSTLLVELTVVSVSSSRVQEEITLSPPNLDAAQEDVAPSADDHAQIAQRMKKLAAVSQTASAVITSSPAAHVPHPHAHAQTYAHTTAHTQSAVVSAIAHAHNPPAPVAVLAQQVAATHVAHTVTATQNVSANDGLDALFNELSMTECLPAFRREGLRLSDVSQLDLDELKSLVPTLGPRKRLMAKIAEMQKTPTQNNAAAASSPPQSQSQSQQQTPIAAAKPSASRARVDGASSISEDDLKREYERGKNEAIAIAREKLTEMKDSANARFASLSGELETSKKQREDDINKARDVIQRLRDELSSANTALNQLQAEKDELFDKSRAYVNQIKANHSSAIQSAVDAAAAEQMRTCIDTVYRALVDAITVKEFYEGQNVLDIIKKTMKTVAANAVKINEPTSH